MVASRFRLAWSRRLSRSIGWPLASASARMTEAAHMCEGSHIVMSFCRTKVSLRLPAKCARMACAGEPLTSRSSWWRASASAAASACSFSSAITAVEANSGISTSADASLPPARDSVSRMGVEIAEEALEHVHCVTEQSGERSGSIATLVAEAGCGLSLRETAWKWRFPSSGSLTNLKYGNAGFSDCFEENARKYVAGV